MRYQITHSSQYLYDQAIQLLAHDICLQPRTDAFQTLESFRLDIDPIPQGQMVYLDAIGNLVTRCWWSQDDSFQRLSVVAHSVSRTDCLNPFNYLVDSWATTLPIDYPRSQFDSLSLYLSTTDDYLSSPTILEWAQDLAFQCGGNTIQFLSTLNQFIHQEFVYQSRDLGDPFPPHVTWRQKKGSCRDFVVLFMAACHGVGLASRFVSGYEEGSPEHEQTLHAWVEVYLPGAGWRGYDPTMGLIVCDRHIALAAHRFPALTAPIVGGHRGVSTSTMTAQVTIESLNLDNKD